jgi:beta-lysine 5,6-aminomutase beta subunit
MDIDRDLKQVKPYGDHLNDGMIQLSFTLPVPYTRKAEKAALILANKMGLEKPYVVHYEELLEGYTFFVIYGRCSHTVDYSAIELDDNDSITISQEEIEVFIKEHIKRDIVVVGASTGTDTHTVGIDAILNMKGYNGRYGLERYKGFIVYNLGGQVPNETLLAKAIELNADAILVSQTVTQQQLHIHNLTQLVDLLEAEGIRDDIILLCGGPRISNELAKELGYDAGFSKGCYPNNVAAYIVKELAARNKERHANAYHRFL